MSELTIPLIDFNLHLVPEPNIDLDTDTRGFAVNDQISRVVQEARALGITTGNVMLLDGARMRSDGAGIIERITEAGFVVTAMPPVKDSDCDALVERMIRAGARGIKFHPYIQKLHDGTFAKVVGLARRAAEAGLWIAVCCSYGTVDVFDISGPRLVAALVRGGITAPIVALHAGGAAVLDVMSVALDAGNVFLETSFSVAFWRDSSVESDLAFAIRKVGVDRCLYGSDHPYVDMKDSIAWTASFLDRHGFSESEMRMLFSGTATGLIGIV